MEFLEDFLHTKDIQKAKIFELLRCKEQEAIILQYMTKALLDGVQEVGVIELVHNCFGEQVSQDSLSTSQDLQGLQNPAKATKKTTKKDSLQKQNSLQNPLQNSLYEKPKQSLIITHLPTIRTLLDLGWIVLSEMSRFKQPNIKDLALLELLSCEVSLSSAFLRLIERGHSEVQMPDETPYNDHLEYVKDQFLRIHLASKFSPQNDKKNTALKSQINALENRIKERLLITTKEISAHKIIKDYALNPKEEMIFFALLKEEYYGGDGYYRDMNNLIDLISESEYDKMKNRALLDEKSTLIEKGLLDFGEMLNPFGGIVRTFYIPEEILHKVIREPYKKKSKKIALASVLEEQEIFELLRPKSSLDEIVLPQSTRTMIDSILKQVDSSVVARLKQWGIKDKHKGVEAKILFYGAAGTGKTLSALAIAKALKKQVLSFDCSKILSMYVGESEKNVRKIFDTYSDISKKIKNEPVLLLDEADQFLSTRITSSSGAEKMHNQMQNIFLEQIERFSGVLVATTNLVESIDSAFSRRFDYKIEFRRPNEEQRRKLWEKYLPKNAQYEPNSTIESLCKELSSHSLSGAQIALVIKNTAYKVATRDKPIFAKDDFIEAIKRELSGDFDSSKSVGFI